MKKFLSFYNKFWLNLFWALEPCIKGTWEGRLQNGDEIHIRFQLTTWKCILQSCSILPTPAAHKGIPLFILRKEIEFLLGHLFVESWKIVVKTEENWAQVTSARGAMNWDLFFPFIPDNRVYRKHKISKSRKQLLHSADQQFSVLVWLWFSRFGDLIIWLYQTFSPPRPSPQRL